MANLQDDVDFDEAVLLALAHVTAGPSPGAHVRARLMASLTDPLPAGFAVRYADDEQWQRHPVPGIKMKVLSEAASYVTLLLDVAPGTRFPPHFHGGAEECYVLRGSLHTCGRHLHAGDFVHADGDTHHGELHTDEGCQVLLIVPPAELAEWQSLTRSSRDPSGSRTS